MFRKLSLGLMIIDGLAAIGSLFVRPMVFSHHEIKSCFHNAQGIKSGAVVRIAGVDVGTVRSVRADPLNRNCPAEVEMALATSYDLPVPKDAVVGIETAEILGQSYLDIDVSQASGSAIQDYGYLKSKPGKPTLSLEDQLHAAEVLVRFVEAAKEAERGMPAEHPRPPRQPDH